MAIMHFAPFTADAGHSFDRRRAAHLLRRAGFGCSPEEIEGALDRGLEATVDQLFADNRAEELEFQQTFRAINGSFANFADAAQLQAWWLYRMMKTRMPLREKVTLFWHGHFATSYKKFDDLSIMHQQIETLRRHAWGSFRTLLRTVAKDPAMLIWLDGESSTKDHPNENFARELLELFTCGIGHYTEMDVREASRAFTGWHRDGAKFIFHAEEHDAEPKEFLCKAGNFDGGDIIDVLLQHPPTSRFLARKLLRFFACPEPGTEVVTEAAARLRETDFNIQRFLRELFLSRFFFSDACYRRRISSPAEFVVGTVRFLQIRIAALDLKDHLVAMGQELYAPPNVNGWDGERKWINSSTWSARAAFGEQVAALQESNPFTGHLPLGQIVPPDMTDPKQVVDTLADRLFQGDLAPAVRQHLGEYLVATAEGPRPQRFREDDRFRFEQTRNALGVMLGMPEYQLY